MTLWKLTIASIKMYIRDKQALFWALFFPFLIMIIFGLINFEDGGTFNVGLINKSPAPAAQEFIKTLKGTETLKITEAGDESERKALEKGDRDVVMVLPESFFGSVQPTEPQKIQVLINEGRPQQTQAALSILGEIFSEMENQMLQKPKIFLLETQSINSRNLRYIDFLVPGIVAFSIMQLAIFSIAFSVVEYKEKGIMKRLFVAPLRPIDFTLSQVFTKLLITLVQVTILISVAILIFHIKITGSYFLILLLTVMGSLLFLGTGFAIAGIAKNQDSAAPLANIFSFPQMFLGNVFFPIDSMPDWLQKIVVYLPLNYLADGLRKVATESAGFMDIKKDLLGLLVWIIISIIIALKLFRWQKVANQG